MDVEWIHNLNRTETRIPLPAPQYTSAVNYAWRTGKLSAEAANLLMQIVEFSKDVGYCHVSNSQLAWATGVSTPQGVSWTMRILQDELLLQIERPANNKGKRKLIPNIEWVNAPAPSFVVPSELLTEPRAIPEHRRYWPKDYFRPREKEIEWA